MFHFSEFELPHDPFTRKTVRVLGKEEPFIVRKNEEHERRCIKTIKQRWLNESQHEIVANP